MASPTAPTTIIKWRPVGDDTEQRLLRKICAVLTAGLGLGGSDYVADTSPHVAPSVGWVIIHAVTDTVFASVTYAPNFPHSGSLAGVTLKAGDRIYGEFTAFQLTSGSVEAYRATI